MNLDFLNKLSNLQQRLIAGLLGGGFMISLICWSEWSYFFLFFSICYFALREFYNLISSAGIKPNKLFGIISGQSIFTLLFLLEKKVVSFDYYYLLFASLFLLFLLELFKDNEKPFVNIAFSFLGNLYIAVPFALMNVSAFISGVYDYQIVLGILFMLWANDIGGYFLGRFLGKNLLFPRVSPKKTWEGAIGGALVAMLVSVLLNNIFETSLTQIHWSVVAMLIVVAGSYGDLVESMLKRSLSLKDSAQAIPGHGGFLDRFDGLLLASPFVAAFLKLFF